LDIAKIEILTFTSYLGQINVGSKTWGAQAMLLTLMTHLYTIYRICLNN